VKLAMQPIWLEVVRRELPMVMGGLGLNGTMVEQSSKIGAWLVLAPGEVGTDGQSGLNAGCGRVESNTMTSPCRIE
jgi:hypothetical protein